METDTKMLREGVVKPDELSRIPHTICSADFNTNYHSPNRISRIASEISEYLKYKNRDKLKR